MGCLYCGKEIGTFRQIRDNEFCSSVHRKQYGERLGRALGKIGAPEPPPAPIVGFRVMYPVQAGKSTFICAENMPHAHTPRTSRGWQLTVAPAMGSSFHVPSVDPIGPTTVAQRPAQLTPELRLPGLEFHARAAAPRSCEQWRTTLEAQPAERWITVSVAEALRASIAFETPAGPQIPGTFVRRSVNLAVPLEAEPVEYEVRAVLDSTPARSPRGASLLRFGLHAVEEFAAPAAAMTEPPRASGPLPGLSPAPVESMPALPAFLPAALAPSTAPLLPTIALATAQALTHAQAVAGPAPMPVESFPSVAVFAPVALAPSTGPLLPTIAAAAAQALSHARTVVGPTPAPVESFPSAAAFAPIALALSPAPLLPTIAAVTAQVLPQARAVAGPAPIPVESLPSAPAFAPAALAPSAALLLPTIAAVTAQVLPQAQAVDGPAPIPVESLPAAAAIVPAALEFRRALRRPTLARFQPADDAADALAAPVAAACPAPVESMPLAPAFAALPVPVAPRFAAQSFHPEIRARFDVPVVRGPEPAIAAPPTAAPQPAMLDPMARIAAQPAGAQPERPTPAIPRPGCLALEYYCQPITSAPANRIEPLTPGVGLLHQPFAIPAALGRIEDLLKKKPTRIILPFEEIFARRKRAAGQKRAGINTVGKIAAALMVGIALWAGSRIANLSRQTEEFKAQVAASERTVTVAESHLPDPTQVNYGNSPVGKFRHAVAERAATEITDTFKAGMAAWGAGKQGFAPGWKRDPKGYVSTGDMALFQPSLKYTDYRMEFYGQIEDKSMGWVVRAQDKKNYYAMKFTVIEPGLRPIIAMVHYGVVNGKAVHRVQTPLSVMVHNQKAIHVAVDVRGNHFTTSIDGEPIESWTDDTLAQGGVGFFSDAGERARLYWMKLSRNQDWLGRFCAYLSDGRSKQQAAELWGPGIPDETPGPMPAPAPVLALAAARPWKIRRQRSEAWN